MTLAMHVDCGDPGIPANGDASYENTTLDSTVTYSCNSSYVLCGDDTRTCLPNGAWSGAMPSCICESCVVVYGLFTSLNVS